MSKGAFAAAILVVAAGVVILVYVYILRNNQETRVCETQPLIVSSDFSVANESVAVSSDLRISKKFRHWISLFQTLYGQDPWDCDPINASDLVLTKSVAVAELPKDSVDRIPLFRDIYGHDPWGEKEYRFNTPGSDLDTVHYLWCGEKQLRFQHYLGLLSAVRILQPLKLVFHHTHLPQLDGHWYNTWFQEFKQSAPNLVLRPLNSKASCGSKDMLKEVLGFLAKDGGVFVGEGVILASISKEIEKNPLLFSLAEPSGDLTRGIILSRSGFDKHNITLDQYSDRIATTKPGCRTIDDYNNSPNGDVWCIRVDNNMYPQDTWEVDTPFGELVRWIYYGRREKLRVKPSPDNLIPRITHYVWLKPRTKMEFVHFLSVLSALYVGGFHHVYIHGEEVPNGEWWKALSNENVTFVKTEPGASIFQQGVGVTQHISDWKRLNILHKYGGAYQDSDVIWASKVPDELLTYPTIISMDWQRYGEWPAGFNTGVILSRKRAPWLSHFLASHRFYRDHDWGFNSIKMSYRMYEHHPDQLYVDLHLQVIYFDDICHPAWHKDYLRAISDHSPTTPFNWSEARAFHLTQPKNPRSLSSASEVKNGKDFLAEIGRLILKESKREYLYN